MSIFVEDNDTAGVVIVNTDNHSKEDGSESGSLTVRLQSRPFDNITINLKVLADNLSHAVELSPSSMNFDNSTDNWSSVQTVIVSSIDDSVDEDSYGNDNQTFYIALDNISSVIAADAKYVNNVSATGKISVSENQTVDNLTVFSLDNDTMGVMVVVVDNNSSENGTRGQMLVSLRSQPYDNVTLSFTIDNGTSATGIATGYCFPWIISHQVTIRPQSLVFSSSEAEIGVPPKPSGSLRSMIRLMKEPWVQTTRLSMCGFHRLR